MTLTPKQQAFIALVRRNGKLGISASATPGMARMAEKLLKRGLIVVVECTGAYVWYTVA